MIQEDICTYEVCKLAKENGFDEYVNAFYAEDCDTPHSQGPEKWNNYEGRYSAPTQSLLQRWLREEKGIVILINIGYCYENKDTPFYENPNMEPIFNGYYYGIWMLDDLNDNLGRSNYFPTYELALEDALKFALENLV